MKNDENDMENNRVDEMLLNGSITAPLQIFTSSTPLGNSSVISGNDRSLEWVGARSKKQTDETYYIPIEKPQEVYDKVVSVY